MHVTTRSGQVESLSFDAILHRIEKLAYGLNVDASKVTKDTISILVDNISTITIDEYSAKSANDLQDIHPDYALLGGRISVSNIQKQTLDTFSEASKALYDAYTQIYADAVLADDNGILDADEDEYIKEVSMDNDKKFINPDCFKFIEKHANLLDSMIVHERDFGYTYNAIKQIKAIYLRSVNDILYDRPQYVYMRIAVCLWKDICEKNPEYGFAKLRETYDLLSTKMYTHATPTILNSCLTNQLVSCFLLGRNDSIEDIMKGVSDMSVISKFGGGIGIDYSNIRAAGTLIKGTNGLSSGIMPQLKIIESLAKCWNQGGKRNGSICIYLGIWHKDIFEFIEMRKPTGSESTKCRRLFHAIWGCNLFFKRMEEYIEDLKNGRESQVYWTLFDSVNSKRLSCHHGAKFEKIYLGLESRGKGRRVPMSSLVTALVTAIVETGSPFLCNMDAANECSTQKNYGHVSSSNLCTEIYLVAKANSYACCNLASLNLPSFIKNEADGSKSYDLERLGHVVEHAIECLDRVVTVNQYPTPECMSNSLETRPLGLGVQGLATTFQIMDLPYLSEEAKNLDKAIFETIYYHSVKKSAELASHLGSYPYFEGSPMHKGQFHWEMFEQYSGRKYEHYRTDLDWESLRESMRAGMRNSTLIALMPTESTSKMHGNSPCIEPQIGHSWSNKSDISGNTTYFNETLIRKLIDRKLWEGTRHQTARQGNGIPLDDCPDLEKIYMPFGSMPKNEYLRRVADKQYMVDQGISLNLWFDQLRASEVIKYIMAGYKLGLKTINYYVKQTSGAFDPMKVGTASIKNNTAAASTYSEEEKNVCRRDNPENCFMCEA